MYAIVEIAGQQYRAEEGRRLLTGRLQHEVGTSLNLDSVLLIQDGERHTIGSPYVKDASVRVTVEGHGRDRKVVVYKYKRRKGYHRKQGHRQMHSLIRIEAITVP